jgi:hypothetical protein
MLGNDVKPRIRHQVMDVGYAPSHRVLDRDHPKVDVTGTDCGEGVLEGRRRYRLVVGKHVAASQMRVGARLSLKYDFLDGRHA